MLHAVELKDEALGNTEPREEVEFRRCTICDTLVLEAGQMGHLLRSHAEAILAGRFTAEIRMYRRERRGCR